MNTQLFHKKYLLYWVSFVLSLLVLLPIVFSLPDFLPYQLEHLSTRNEHAKNVIVFNDLNFDGEDERIIFDKDFTGTPALLVEKGANLLYQINFKGNFCNGVDHYIEDYDNNGQKEICVLTIENDSIFLFLIEGLTGRRLVSKVYISNVKHHSGNLDYGIYDLVMEDINGDGIKEVILPFMCGFTYVTRKVCIYDIHKRVMYESPKTGCSLYDGLIFYDLDKDGTKEIFGTTSAYSNCPKNYPFTDKYAWLQVLDCNARFSFKPIKLGTSPAHVRTCPIVMGEENGIAVFYKHSGGKGEPPFIAIYSRNGELLKKKEFEYESNLRNTTLFSSYPDKKPTQLLLYREDGTLEIFDSNLKLISHRQSTPINGIFAKVDLDGDNEKEQLFYNYGNGTFMVTRRDYSFPICLELGTYTGTNYISKVDTKSGLFNFQIEDKYFSFNYKKNPLYPFRNFIRFLAWLVIFLFFVTVGYLFQLIAKRRYENEKKLNQMQLAAIENQLNPHFNLNILNSIGALYESHEKEKAQYYFGKYNKLLRQSLFQSGHLSVPLFDELDFTLNYLELEKLRMNERFNFKVSGDENLPEIKIPKMLIHTFVENAVKHGLKHSKGNGLLKVDFVNENGRLIISISDNGIGRIKAKQYSLMSTGKGIEIVNKSLQLFFETQNRKIEYKITDLYNAAGEAAGTQVDIEVPN